MNKYAFLILVSFMSASSLRAMEAYDEYNPVEWPEKRLGTLLEQAQSSTCCTYNAEIRARKLHFVQYWLEKHKDHQAILSDLSKETGGVIRATVDPELAKKDSNKFLSIDPLKYSATEIQARWMRIHHADCKYSGPRLSADSSKQCAS